MSAAAKKFNRMKKVFVQPKEGEEGKKDEKDEDRMQVDGRSTSTAKS